MSGTISLFVYLPLCLDLSRYMSLSLSPVSVSLVPLSLSLFISRSIPLALSFYVCIPLSFPLSLRVSVLFSVFSLVVFLSFVLFSSNRKRPGQGMLTLSRS